MVRAEQFQSSPAPKGRCCGELAPDLGLELVGFNPHRPRRAGAAADYTAIVALGKEFQSSPAPKGRCCQGVGQGLQLAGRVSILTGPEGPVLQRSE